MNQNRIAALDGFRFLAITLVVLFHYYSRYAVQDTINYYPYASAGKNIITDHGNLGVQLFFIISGFVIYFTILSANNIREFLIKRWVRLFPPILLASLLTFILVELLDPSHYFSFHRSYLAFLPSLTFTDPFLWKKLLHNSSIEYVDGVYWSLAAEVKFYLLIGIFYFIRPQRLFMKNWSLLNILLLALNVLPLAISHPAFSKLLDVVNFISIYHYLPYFSIGIYFYHYWQTKKFKWYYIIPFVQLFFLLKGTGIIEIAFICMFLALFFLLTRGSRLVRIFEWNWIRRIGIVSYMVYLMHETVGIILISRFCNLIPYKSVWPFIPCLVYLMFILFAELVFRFYELPAKKLLYRVFFTKKAPKLSVPQM